MDMDIEEKKKSYAIKVIDLLIGRCYPMADISDPRKKHNILGEAEVFYSDHITGDTGGKASFHNVEQRFPNLNEKIRNELSSFAERMHEADEDFGKVEQVIRDFGISVDFQADKLKMLMNQRR